MSIVIPTRRPALAAPARASTEEQAARAVTFGARDTTVAAATHPVTPARPGSAAVARSTPSAASAAASSSVVPPPARSDRPPFRPSSAHPRDASFYSSSYMTSATAGVTATARERERERERSPPPVLRAGATAAAHAVAAASLPAEAATSDHSQPTGVGTSGGGTSSGPSIPVRHTHRSTLSIRSTRDAAESSAKAGEALKTSTAEMNTEALKAHYTPLLAARHARLDDLKSRLRKQEARLQTMQAWKLKALDKAASEPNALDLVLSASGVTQSLAVRSKRIILQRTIIRQFLRTFRLLRSLKIVHRHLRTMIPLLLDSPNSVMEAETRAKLAQVMTQWSREPAPLGPRASKVSGAGGLGVSIPTAPLSPGSPSSFSPRGSAVGGEWSPPPSSVTSPQALNALKASERFYLSRHPHSYTQTLLSNLFSAVPLLEEAIVQNLQARQELDKQAYSQMLRNTKLVSRAEFNAAQIASKQAALDQLKEDVACVEQEVHAARAEYTSVVSRLHCLVSKETLHQRKLNRIYYSEVAEKLGEEYAVQLALVQQGAAPPWMQAVKREAPMIPAQIASAAASSSSNPPTASAAGRPKKLFLPATLLGNTIPIAPDVIPQFVDEAAADFPDAAAGTGEDSIKIRRIDRGALLGRIDSLLARNPSRSPAAFDAASADAREMLEAHERFMQRQKLEAECARDEAHEHAAEALERDGLQPFFVLAGHPPQGASGHSSKASSRRASSRRRSNPRSMRASDSLGELSPDEDASDGEDNSSRRDEDHDQPDDAGEDPEADRMFSLQRDHFALDYGAAAARTDDADAEESKQQSEYAFRPIHHREDSAPPLPPSLLHPPAKPLAPLHARTLSEVDWHATGPTMPMAHRRRQLNTEERLAAERAKGKRNPHEYFPLTRERVASMIEESGEDDIGSNFSSMRQTRGGGGGGGGVFNLDDAAATLRGSTTPARDDASEHALSPSATHATFPLPLAASCSPESQAWWAAPPASSAAVAISPRHRSPHARGAAATSSSPVVGLSASMYSASLEKATSHLLSLGYSETQAREFAPHVVQVGAIRVPSSGTAADRHPITSAAPQSTRDRSISPHARAHRPSSAASASSSFAGLSDSSSSSRPGSMTPAQGAVYATAMMKRPPSGGGGGGGGGRVPVHTVHAYQPSIAPAQSQSQSQSRGVMSARPSSAHHAAQQQQHRSAASPPHPPPRPVASSSSARPGSAAPSRPSRPNSAALEARHIALMSGMPVSCLVPKPPTRPRPATAGAAR